MQKKALPKGRIGYVKGWVLDEREDSLYQDNARYLRYPPKVVLDQFTERVVEGGERVEKIRSRVVDGIDAQGVYPIKPRNSIWYLDQRREKPKLTVIRCRLPLAPAYSTTAHGSQGQTL